MVLEAYIVMDDEIMTKAEQRLIIAFLFNYVTMYHHICYDYWNLENKQKFSKKKDFV